MSRIVVKNLPPSGVREDELKKHFSDIDNVTDIKLKFNEHGNFRRFAFIGFKSDEGAEKAIEKLNNTFIRNNKITLELCKAIKEFKPDKLNASHQKKRSHGLDSDGELETTHNDGQSNARKVKKIKPDPLDEIKDDDEFKEFLNLQRNLSSNGSSKQIWADDAKLDSSTVTVPRTMPPTSTLPKQEDNSENLKSKRHHRSRPKKKSEQPEKTKPKELFVHTIKASGFPAEVRRKDIKDFFKPLECLSIRINKKDGICYASFKDESDRRFAMKKNLHFWKTSRIRIARHDVKRSRVFIETFQQKAQKKIDEHKKYEQSMKDVEPPGESGRLFIRNLNYSCTQADLEAIFAKYGELTEVHFPMDKKTSLPKGYAYVEFMFPEAAAQAYDELNGTIFQGRNFHIIPSKPKPEPRYDQYAPTRHEQPQSSFKRDQSRQQKEAAPRGKNWNILFLGENAVADIASGFNVEEKGKFLLESTRKEPVPVRVALKHASLVEETRKFLVSNGVELDSFDNPQAPRSRTVMIVKNLPASITKGQLSGMFELHGRVSRVLIPPNGMTAIVEMEEPVEAKLAFRKLAYSKFGDSILYLEWAPVNVFLEKCVEDQEDSDLKQLESEQTGSKILVKNVPFEASPTEVRKIFAAFGELNFVRLPKKVDGQHRGFAFVDYLTREDALRAFKSLCHSTNLYGRRLVLQWAKQDETQTASSATTTTVDESAKTK